MAATNQVQTALLTEHFRYTPLTLLDDIINTVNELVFRAINAIEQGLNDAPAEALGFRPPHANAARDAVLALKQDEIDAGIVQLESLLNATVDKDFDKFEIYALRNILALGHEEDGDLASWVRLAHYQNLDLGAAAGTTTTETPLPTPEEVQLQKRKLHETRKLNALLKEEHARNGAVLAQLHAALGADAGGAPEDAARQQEQQRQEQPPPPAPFAFLAPSPTPPSSAAARPLAQDVQYALTHLPALRALLAQLKASLRTLPSARVGASEGDEGAGGIWRGREGFLLVALIA